MGECSERPKGGLGFFVRRRVGVPTGDGQPLFSVAHSHPVDECDLINATSEERAAYEKWAAGVQKLASKSGIMKESK